MENKKCNHKDTYDLKKNRKNYPFGRKSKSKFGEVRKTTTKCCSCKRTLEKW